MEAADCIDLKALHSVKAVLMLLPVLLDVCCHGYMLSAVLCCDFCVLPLAGQTHMTGLNTETSGLVKRISRIEERLHSLVYPEYSGSRG